MTVFLGIPPDSGIYWGNFPWFVITRDLQTWFRSCCRTHQGTHVRTIGHRVSTGHFDGLVYLVGDRSDSIITRVGAPESPNLDVGQTSQKNGEMLSEVYVNPLSAYGTAATIYHELLHNKLGIWRNIHGTPDGNFTSALAPYSLGGPSDADQGLMCEALSAGARQFLGGFPG